MEFMQLSSMIKVSPRKKFLEATKQIEKINLGLAYRPLFYMVYQIKLSTLRFKSMIIPKL